MDQIRVRGGQALKGTIRISGAKNAALPLMTVGLLTDQPVVLRNVPALADIESMTNLHRQHAGAL
jgi:UDP-N-acetylglucosamine 1-carboxyvinyltransferase